MQLIQLAVRCVLGGGRSPVWTKQLAFGYFFIPEYLVVKAYDVLQHREDKK